MSVVKSLLAASLAFGFISVVGCSSDNDDTPADTTDPVISNLSHADNETVIGNRTITFTVDVTDNSTLTVTMTHNDNPVTVTPSGDTYSANITLADRTNNTIVVTANDGNNTASQTIGLNYPFLAFTDGQAASVVIGQADFTGSSTNRGVGLGVNGLNKPRGITVVNGKLYIADKNNNRVLGYNAIPTADQNADFVIGQDGFDMSAIGLEANQLKSPISISSVGSNFFISQGYDDTDAGPGKVHQWNTVPITNQLADNVIGESDFGLQTDACSNTAIGFGIVTEGVITYRKPSAESVFTVDNKLIVADSSNNRVLIWNSIPTSKGQAANVVLGQQDFIHCAENDSNNDGVSETSPTASTLYEPTSIWSDGTRLAVADHNNARVLIWNSFPITNFQPADNVLGQVNFTSNSLQFNASATAYYPLAVTSNGNQFFVSDSIIRRVLIWNSFPADEINQPANQVLGKISLTSESNLSPDKNIELSKGMFVNEDMLLVSDEVLNRVLVFKP